jgi:hypothetical protein
VSFIHAEVSQSKSGYVTSRLTAGYVIVNSVFVIVAEYVVPLSFCTNFQIHYYQLDIPRIKEYKGDSWSVSIMIAPSCNIRPMKVFVNNPQLLKRQEVIISRTIGGILSKLRFWCKGFILLRVGMF